MRELALIVAVGLLALPVRAEDAGDFHVNPVDVCWVGKFPPKQCDGRESYCETRCVEYAQEPCILDSEGNTVEWCTTFPMECLKRVEFCGVVVKP